MIWTETLLSPWTYTCCLQLHEVVLKLQTLSLRRLLSSLPNCQGGEILTDADNPFIYYPPPVSVSISSLFLFSSVSVSVSVSVSSLFLSFFSLSPISFSFLLACLLSLFFFPSHSDCFECFLACPSEVATLLHYFNIDDHFPPDPLTLPPNNTEISGYLYWNICSQRENSPLSDTVHWCIF